ncbi:MAG: RDD family protein [Dehalococcoidales bacterium]|nr:RDD family protein [Dehalococcoidales bacterium]MDX9986379.1 RDD family protein [Dehalococcoidales bacterium]NLE90802.1 RDD family protein [Dehalococcoidales bacterium]
MEQEERIIVEYAGFWRRLGAFLIDALIVGSMNCVLTAPWRWIFSVSRPWHSEGWLNAFFYHDPFVGITVLIAAIYCVVFWLWRGQTPGKIVMNVKVLKEDGTPLTLSGAIVRFLGYMVCFMTLGIGFVILAFDERRQGLHDKIALTVVVKIPQPKLRLPEANIG